MGIVTLTTDLGYRDPYLAIVKAKLLSSPIQPQILDLSCDIKENNISDAAFILRNTLPHFPKDTVHLVSVKFIADRSRNSQAVQVDNSRFLLTKYMDQFIVTPDTGLFTLLDPAFNAAVYQIFYSGENKHHFFLKDVFVDVALSLLEKKDPDEVAVVTDDFYKSYQFESYVNGNMLRGKGIYVDDFGNIITNITREKFKEVAGKRKFTITLPGARLDRIYNTYDEVRFGAPLVLFNSFDYLEVAANGKSAYELLCPRDIGTTFDFNLLIEFHD
jgi:S-adenosylmethionine hydrolase